MDDRVTIQFDESGARVVSRNIDAIARSSHRAGDEVERLLKLIDRLGVKAPSVAPVADVLHRVEQASGAAVAGVNRATKSVDGLGRQAARAAQPVLLFQRILGLLGVGVVGRELVQMADTLQNLENRFTFVTGSAAGASSTINALGAIALRTRANFEEVGVVYTRTAFATKQLGLAQEDTLAFTEALNQAVILGGSSAVEAKAGLQQLSQALASNRLAGDELRSVLEQLPVVADAIGKRFGTTGAGLKALIQQDRDFVIGTKDIIAAILAEKENLDAAFAKTTPTIGQSFEQLRTATTLLVREFNQSTGTAESFARSISFIARNLGTLTVALGYATLALIAFNRQAINGAILTALGNLPRLSAAYLAVGRAIQFAHAQQVVFNRTAILATLAQIPVLLAAIGTAGSAGAVGVMALAGALGAVAAPIIAFLVVLYPVIKLMEILGRLAGNLATGKPIFENLFDKQIAQQAQDSKLLAEAQEQTVKAMQQQGEALDTLRGKVNPLQKEWTEYRDALNLVRQAEADGNISMRQKSDLLSRIEGQMNPLVTGHDELAASVKRLEDAEAKLARQQIANKNLGANIDLKPGEDVVRLAKFEVQSNVADELKEFQTLLDTFDPVAAGYKNLQTKLVGYTAAQRVGIISQAQLNYLIAQATVGSTDLAGDYATIKDRLDPLGAATRRHAKDTLILKAVYEVMKLTLANFPEKLEAIRLETQKLLGLLDVEFAKAKADIADPGGKGAKSADEFADKVKALRDELDPLGAATRKYAADLALLIEGNKKGILTDAQLAQTRVALDLSIRDARSPVHALTRAYEQELAVLNARTPAAKAMVAAQQEANKLMADGHVLSATFVVDRAKELQSLDSVAAAWKDYDDAVKSAQATLERFIRPKAITEFNKDMANVLETLKGADLKTARTGLLDDLLGSVDSGAKTQQARKDSLALLDMVQTIRTFFGQPIPKGRFDFLKQGIIDQAPTAAEALDKVLVKLNDERAALTEADPIKRETAKIVAELTTKYQELDAVAITPLVEGILRLTQADKDQIASLGRVQQMLGISADAAKHAALDFATLHEEMGRGQLTLDQYETGLLKLELAALKTDTTIQGGLRRGLIETQLDLMDLSKTAEDTVTGAFQSAEDSIVKLVETGKFAFKDSVSSILADLARLATQALFKELLNFGIQALGIATGGGGGTGYDLTGGSDISPTGGDFVRLGAATEGLPQGRLPSDFASIPSGLLTTLVTQTDMVEPLLKEISKKLDAPTLNDMFQMKLKEKIVGLLTPGAGFGGGLFGFERGGSFMVPGSGPPDSRTVAFRASPGERIDVSTRDQQRNGQGRGGMQINVQIHNTVSDRVQIRHEYDELRREFQLYIEENPERIKAGLRL